VKDSASVDGTDSRMPSMHSDSRSDSGKQAWTLSCFFITRNLWTERKQLLSFTIQTPPKEISPA
jgi:hypothetical protein